MRQQQMPPVIQAMYDLTIWLMERVEKFPRSSRFVLGDRIEESALQIMRLLIEADWSKDRRDLLRRANLELDQLRFLVRISLDRHFIAPKQYAFASEKMTEVSKHAGPTSRCNRRHTLRSFLTSLSAAGEIGRCIRRLRTQMTQKFEIEYSILKFCVFLHSEA